MARERVLREYYRLTAIRLSGSMDMVPQRKEEKGEYKMVELQPVSFAFNQNEYETMVPTNNEHEKVIFRLSDSGALIAIVLNQKTHGIENIRTLTEDEAKGYKEIWDAKVVGSNSRFNPGMPQYYQYEIKLQDGRIVSAEPRKESWGTPYWEQRYIKARIPAEEVVGWRIARIA